MGCQNKVVPNHATRMLGPPPGTRRNDPNNYMKKMAKSNSVPSLAEVKKDCPELLVPSSLQPRMKGGVPKRSEQPVMNLVSSKNFIGANAVETILAAPKKVSQGAKDYLKREDYGKVPKYLTHIKRDIDAEYDYIRQLQQEHYDANQPQVRPLDDAERLSMIGCLKAKWEQVNSDYQGSTHLTIMDTMGKMQRKEKYEATLAQIEKDIEKLSKRSITIDMAG